MELLRIHHFAFVVGDLNESVWWYGEVLGFTLERRFGFSDAGVEIAHVVSPVGVRIELIQQQGSAAGSDAGRDAFGALHTQGAKHIGLEVADLDAAAAELRSKGVELVHDIRYC